MTTATQVLLPLATILLVAGGSLIGWVILFRNAARSEAASTHPSGPTAAKSHK
ncbi:MAG TPA: hypothetical protein VMV23_05270 [Candidatus Nanopelagicaceae bacterium]|nr:hypothetical protein [Candidatus Nanopelagicaceae bacterium]